MTIQEKIKYFIQKLNENGIPIPLVSINGKPTFTGTLAFISFNTALLGQIGKVTKLIGEVDLTQANYLFLICLGSYLGNKVVGKDNISIEPTKEENK